MNRDEYNRARGENLKSCTALATEIWQARKALRVAVDALRQSGTPAALDALAEIDSISTEIAEIEEARECNACEWRGLKFDCVWLGKIGPLCPKCHETTGP